MTPKPKRTPPKGETVTEGEKMAFVAGARWWEVRQTGFTMWPSDQQEAYDCAEKIILAMRRVTLVARKGKGET